MLVGRIAMPVLTLGPGKRTVLWVQGCEKRCRNCANPELQSFDKSKDLAVTELYKFIISTSLGLDGITITGGEPFAQPDELAVLTRLLHEKFGDILIYTGYTISELRALRKACIDEALSYTAALIDGLYIEELNTGTPLKGSANQRLHVLNEHYTALYADETRKEANRIQNIPTEDGMLSVGIHVKGFRQQLNEDAVMFGLEKGD